MATPTRVDQIAGTLFGTAIGDALGLYVEGLTAATIARKFGRVDRFLFPFGLGVLSDDTEQSALVAEALLMYGHDVDEFEAYLRWLLVKWFWTFPPGIGKATFQACLNMTVGSKQVSMTSGGNGAAMRAAVIGTFFPYDSIRRKTFGVRAARVTHGNDEAVDGALYVAEVSAACTQAAVYERYEVVHQAVMSIPYERLHDLIEKAMTMAEAGATVEYAALELGCTGYVMHSVALATFCFLRFGADPREALIQIVSCGGDTDSNAAILGAWLGALHGRSGLPNEWAKHLVEGPINLSKLSRALAGEGTEYGGFSYLVGLFRNLLLLPFALVIAIFRLFY